MNAVIGESAASSKSMRTCLVSLPQMPVRRVRSTAHAGPRTSGSGTSRSAIGVVARWRTRRGASGGAGAGAGSGSVAEDERPQPEDLSMSATVAR